MAVAARVTVRTATWALEKLTTSPSQLAEAGGGGGSLPRVATVAMTSGGTPAPSDQLPAGGDRTGEPADAACTQGWRRSRAATATSLLLYFLVGDGARPRRAFARCPALGQLRGGGRGPMRRGGREPIGLPSPAPVPHGLRAPPSSPRARTGCDSNARLGVWCLSPLAAARSGSRPVNDKPLDCRWLACRVVAGKVEEEPLRWLGRDVRGVEPSGSCTAQPGSDPWRHGSLGWLLAAGGPLIWPSSHPDEPRESTYHNRSPLGERAPRRGGAGESSQDLGLHCVQGSPLGGAACVDRGHAWCVVVGSRRGSRQHVPWIQGAMAIPLGGAALPPAGLNAPCRCLAARRHEGGCDARHDAHGYDKEAGTGPRRVPKTRWRNGRGTADAGGMRCWVGRWKLGGSVAAAGLYLGGWWAAVEGWRNGQCGGNTGTGRRVAR